MNVNRSRPNIFDQIRTMDPNLEFPVGPSIPNFLAYVPVLNFFVGYHRIKNSVTHIKLINEDPENLTKERICKWHIFRGAVELVPGASLLFVVPDLIVTVIAVVFIAIVIFIIKLLPFLIAEIFRPPTRQYSRFH